MKFVKNKVHLALVLVPLILSGCSLSHTELEQSLLTQDNKSVIEMGRTTKLEVNRIWPLTVQGTYLQNVKTTVQGQEYAFSVHLTLESNKIECVAYNEIYGRLYHLTWTPTAITWETSEHISATVKPENVMADFLLIHLSFEQLKSSLIGATVREENNQRIIEGHSGVLRKINRQNPIKGMWQSAMLYNPEFDYKLDIQTVALQ
jgi:hypothetical protein